MGKVFAVVHHGVLKRCFSKGQRNINLFQCDSKVNNISGK